MMPIVAWSANESPQTFTLDGQLFQAGTNSPLLDSAVKIKLQILNPTATCLLYEEEQTANTMSSDGKFTIYVGSATGATKRTVNDPGRTMNQIFQNMSAITANSVPGQTCAGGLYVPLQADVRYFRLIITPSASNAPNTLTPDIVLDTVPQALVAQSVQGLERTGILQVNTSGSTVLNQANLEAVFTTPAYTNLQSILAGNFIKTDTSGATLPTYAADPAGAANGDIWFDSVTNEIKYKNAAGVQVVGVSGGGITSLTVGSSMSVNGSVAGTISGSGTIDLSNTGVTAGTYTKMTVDAKGRVTAGTVSLVEGDIPNLTSAGKVSGNTITSGTISGSAGVNTSGNLITTATVSGLTVQATNLRVYSGVNYLQMTASTMSGNVNLTLPATTGSAGQFLSTDGNGLLSWSGITSLLAGDVSGAFGSTSVDKIKGKAVTAGSVSGQMMIYDGTAWGNSVMSGDATLAHDGMFSLNKVPVSKGGTNATTFGINRIIASNGTGSALQDFTCSLNQVITFDGSGNAACANPSTLFSAILNGGNTTGADISIGTNDNKALNFKVNNTVAMTISQSGFVGIGNTNPGTALSISGGGFYSPVRVSTTTDNLIDVLSTNGSGRVGLALSGRNGSNPWMIHTGGSDTGLYFKAGNNINSSPDRLMIKGTGEVGVGTVTPAEMLEVSGAIKLGTTTGTNSGTIRWDGTNFQGYNGSAWANFVPNPPASGACDSTNTYTSAGTYTYTVPASFGTITVRVWGGGGAGGNANSGAAAGNGGTSSVGSLGLVAGGGTGGGSEASGDSAIFGPGGAASGGTVSTAGNPGTAANAGISGAGGSAPNGGVGGNSVTGNANGAAGSAPGGGGSGASNNTAGDRGAGGGSGGYVEKVFTSASLTPGTAINDIIVGAGGASSLNGGVGGAGRVSIACSTTGTPAANDRGVMFMDGTQHASATNFVYDASGNVGIGTAAPSSALTVSGAVTVRGMTSAPPASPANQGRIYYDHATNKFRISENGSAYLDLLSATGSTISVNSVSYGNGAQTNSCGTYVQTQCQGSQGCSYTGSNANCGGDPASGQLKVITVSYSCGGNTYSKVSSEDVLTSLSCGQNIIPDGNDLGRALTIGTTDSYEFSFITNNVTAMTISQSGNIGIGTNSPAARLDVADSGTTTSAIIVPRAGNFTGTTVNGMIRYNTSSTLFEFRENGAWVNYTTVSDERLKTNVVPVEQGLNIVNQLNPVFYDWNPNNPKSQGFAQKHQVGFIAQEVEKVLPEVVNKGQDDYRSVEYGKIVSVVVAAVKELYQKVLGIEDDVQKLQLQNKAAMDVKDREIQSLKQENASIKTYLCKKDPSAEICKN